MESARDRMVYFRGGFVRGEDAQVSVFSHAFLYGTACFEGIRAYASADSKQLYLFRPQEHYRRLKDSARILRMAVDQSAEELSEITAEMLRRNQEQEDIYVRAVAYKSAHSIGAKLHGIGHDIVVFGLPFGPYLDNERGLRVCVSSWRRISDNAIPSRAKINGNYVNAGLAKSEAVEDGYDETVMLTEDGDVAEGPAANVFLVREGVLITPPRTADILEGITRDTVLTLAGDQMGLAVEERVVDRTELYVADEVFFTGTGVQIAPVAEIDRRPIGNGNPGPITRELQDLYGRVVRGDYARYEHWCWPVY